MIEKLSQLLTRFFFSFHIKFKWQQLKFDHCHRHGNECGPEVPCQSERASHSTLRTFKGNKATATVVKTSCR